jgi:putative tryptophan/tyrosine transport system substrate-binding protein
VKRRQALIATAFLACAVSLRAQERGRVYRVALVMGPDNDDARRFLQAFTEGMTEHGYQHGRNVVLKVRHYDRERSTISAVVDELIAWQPDVLVANVSSTAAVLKKKTATVPIVMVTAVDAVAEGLVASLSRPGGNITGMTSLGPAMYAKLVDLTRELMPRATRVAVVVNPGHSLAKSYEAACAQAARALGLEMVTLQVTAAPDIRGFVDRLSRARADALVIASDAVLFTLRDELMQAALEVKVPAVALLPEFVASGAVAALGFDMAGNYRAAARYVDRILKGARPGELPVEQPTRFELSLNLKSARSLGLAIPQSVLVRADRVIE